MARIAVAGHPAFEVSEIEARRPGPHYSVETLEAIRRERPDDDLFFLIGADSLVDLPHWREPDADRRDWPRSSSRTARASRRPTSPPSSRPSAPTPGRSSTSRSPRSASPRTSCGDIVAEGRSIRYRVPRGVEAYIEENGLYR